MSEQKIHQPHDRLIKYTYGRKESAMRFFQAYLPPALAAEIDWDGLELRPGSFVDPALQDQHTDLLYQVPFHEQPLLLYCLFEHQSSPDPWMGLRLLAYQTSIWREVLKATPKPDTLPPIHTVVLYSGRERWRTPLRWLEKLALPPNASPELAQKQVDFAYQLVDLSQLSAEEIRGDVAGKLTLSLMKAATEDRVLDWLEHAAPLLRLLQQTEVTGMFDALLRYVLAVDSNVNQENLFATVERLANPELTNEAMSIADQLIEEGLLRGRKEGRVEGEAKGFEKGEAKGFEKGSLFGGIQIMQDLLGLPQNSRQELEALSPEARESLLKELKARLMKR